MQARQLLTLSGLASVILIVVAFGVGDGAPETGTSGAAVKAFYVDHSSSQQLSAYVVMFAVPFLIFFAAALRSALVEWSDTKSAIWANILLCGAVIAGAGLLLSACLQLALVSAPKDVGASAMQALNALAEQTWPAFTGGLGVFLLGAAGAMIPIRSGLRWLGWIALVLGILIFTPAGFVGFAGSGLWIVLTSVAMTMRLRAPKAGLRESVATL
jgi:hypothetical protein